MTRVHKSMLKTMLILKPVSSPPVIVQDVMPPHRKKSKHTLETFLVVK